MKKIKNRIVLKFLEILKELLKLLQDVNFYIANINKFALATVNAIHKYFGYIYKSKVDSRRYWGRRPGCRPLSP